MAALWTLVAAAAAINVYAGVLILLRGWLYPVAVYRPMLLNLALSWMPIVLVVLFWLGLSLLVIPVVTAVSMAGPVLIWLFLALSLIAWIAFFPNASYLITELNFSHRRDEDPVPLWFDIIQTLTLSVAGIANALLSLFSVQVISVLLVDPNSADITGAPVGWILSLSVILLGTLGVYIGRFVRLNSWDVLKPNRLLGVLFAHFRQPGQLRTATGYVISYSLLLLILYVPLVFLISADLTALASVENA